MQIKSVFFDFDGVIVDSEKIYFIFWKKAIEQRGYHILDEQILNLRSADKKVATKYLHDNIDSKIDLDEYNNIRNLRIKLMNEYLKTHTFQLKQGVVEILEYLKSNNVKCFIVSSSYKQDIEKYLEQFNLKKYFENVISTKNIENGKPFPDVYNLAISLIDCKKENILAIEDSPNGIISAKQAHLNTCMVIDLSSPDTSLLKSVDILVNNLSELKDYFQVNKII